MMELNLRTAPRRVSYIGSVDGVDMARIDLVEVSGGLWDVISTQVDPEYEGRGYGRTLVKAAGEWAAASSVTLQATCPYADKLLRRDPQFSALMRPQP